jgi:hypothetical protein
VDFVADKCRKGLCIKNLITDDYVSRYNVLIVKYRYLALKVKVQ